VSTVSSLARQLRVIFSFSPKRERYRAEQVRKYLQGESQGAADAEIGRMVARLPTILRESSLRRRYDGYHRYFDVLPRIIFLYHRRVPTAQIAEQLSILATEVGIEAVMTITSKVVAERLNQLS
jgi:hypothetical protein